MSKYAQLENYFNQLLTLDEKSRTVFLQELRDNEPEVYQELLALYGQHDEASQYFAQIEEKINNTLFEKEDRSGETFGNYQLEELIGSGGMAHVYKATRTDGTFQRDAAIKFTKRGLDSENVLARFQYERKILGRLKHENIAQIYDAGMSDEGLPYFVMEYVDGTDIISFAKEKNLNIRQRLNLFQQVCKAVEFAHKNLVIHRDIKPTNILIDLNEKVKLTDFGIAKILNPEEDSELTQMHSQVMTPSYASPEQRKGNFINTTSDVFQLGILLYELTSGEKAYDKEKKEYQFNFDKKLVPAEIISIIQTATREEPEERYNTAEALLQDIKNYLENRPLKARGNNRWYVFRKFAVRNKVLVSFLLIIAAIVSSALVLINEEKEHAEAAATLAEKEQKKADVTKDFLVDIFMQADPFEAEGDTLNVYDLLQFGENNINSLEDNPSIQGSLYYIFSTIYSSLSNFQKADSLVDKSINIFEKNLTDDNTTDLAAAYYNKGAFEVAYDNDFDSGIFYLEKAKDFYQLEKSQNIENLAKVNTELGNCYRKTQNFKKAKEYLTISNKLLKNQKNVLDRVFVNYLLLGKLNMNMENYEEALKSFRDGLFVNDTSVNSKELYNIVCYDGISSSYRRIGLLDSALHYRKKNINLIKEMYGNNNFRIATGYNNLFLIYLDLNKYDSALFYLNKYNEINIGIYDKNHVRFAIYYHNLGYLNLQKRKYNEAKDAFIKSIEIRKKSFNYPNTELARTHKSLGEVYLLNNEYDQAKKHFQKAYESYLHFFGDDHERTENCYIKLQKIDSIQSIY